VTVNADGGFTYTPALNYNAATASLQGQRRHDGFDVATVAITVAAITTPRWRERQFNATEDTALTIAAAGVLW